MRGARGAGRDTLGPTINCTVPLTERQGQRAGCSKRHFGGAHCCTRPQSVRRGAFSCGQEDRGGVAALAPCIFWCAELSFKMICSFTPDHQSRKQLMICSSVGSPCAGPRGACGGICSTPGTPCTVSCNGYAHISALPHILCTGSCRACGGRCSTPVTPYPCS